MAEFCLLCIGVFIIVVFWEFFAAVGALMVAWVCGYLLVSEFVPEIDITYRIAAEEYVQVVDQIESLPSLDGENGSEKENLIQHRSELEDKMGQFIDKKKIWRKYDKHDKENGTKLAMAKRIEKSEKDVRKRQARKKR